MRRPQAVVGVLLACVLLYLFLRSADPQQVLAEARSADVSLLLLAVVLAVSVQVYRAWRWGLLLSPMLPGFHTLFGRLVACVLMGWAITVVLPGRIGEVAKPILLARRDDMTASAAIATVVLERAFDGIAVLVLLATYLAILPAPAMLGDDSQGVMSGLRVTGSAALLVSLLGGAILLRWVRRQGDDPDLESGLVGRLFALLPGKLQDLGRSFVDGLAGLRDGRLVAAIALHSVGIWSVTCLTYFLLFRALGIDLPWYATIPLVALMVVGVLVPTPAGIGGFHKAAQIGLVTLWGVPNDSAIAYALISHALVFLPGAAIGLLLLFREGMTLGSVGALAPERM